MIMNSQDYFSLVFGTAISTMMSTTAFLGLLVLAGSTFAVPAATTDFIETDEFYGPIQKCPKGLSDEELSSCLTERVLSMNTFFQNGIPEINLKSIDPFTMKQFDYTLNLRPIVATVHFTNVVIRHLSTYDSAAFKLNMKQKTMEFEMSAPTIRAEANYAMGGNFVLLQMIGNGPAWIDITGGRIRGNATLKIGQDSRGKEIVQIDTIVMDAEYEDAKLSVSGLFKSHPTLKRSGPLINRLINEYHKELYPIIKPALFSQIADITKGIANSAFANMAFMAEYF